jgi:hypothetical protein
MIALKVQHTLCEIERNMSEIAPYRPPALFKKFLLEGYTAFTLNLVPHERFSDLLRAKLCLGTLITLYDDFADRPATRDPHLLEFLYQLKFGGPNLETVSCPQHRRVLRFARSLFAEMDEILQRLPHYGCFEDVLNFDLHQFYSANQFSSILTAQPYLGNALENRLYTHHNMGMVMVAMMDLMAIKDLELSELGPAREVFLMGQRMGRIFNLLATHQRELLDGDITGELSHYASVENLALAKRKLRQEALRLRKKIESFDQRITTFSVQSFLSGLEKVQRLHEEMEGTI